MGALIMTHSDDVGMVIPPKLAPIQVAIVPIYRKIEQLDEISKVAIQLKNDLEAKGLRVVFDDDDNRKPGWKFAEYEMKGVPVRIAIGPRDLENGTCEVARRDELSKEIVPFDTAVEKVAGLMDEIQDNLFNRALKFREKNTFYLDNWEDFEKNIKAQKGFVYAHWDGTGETEEKIKQLTKATIRCIPLDGKKEEGKCILTGKPSVRRVIFAKAY